MARTIPRGSTAPKSHQEEVEEEEEEPTYGEFSDDSETGEASNDNGMVFQDRYGEPISFAFYKLTSGQKHTLTNLIKKHGGTVTHPRYAETIICSQDECPERRMAYELDPDTFVEEISFIRRCIQLKKYQHYLPAPKALSGRPMGPQQNPVPFTTEDEINLCRFLAGAIPDADAGGRTGGGVYKMQLHIAEARPDEPQLQWIRRHTAESWRSHYKTHRWRLDPIIDRYVGEQPPRADGKGLYPYSRKVNQRNRVRVEVEEEEEEEEQADVGSQGEADGNERMLSVSEEKRKHAELSFVKRGAPKRRRITHPASNRENDRSGAIESGVQSNSGVSGTTLLNSRSIIEIEDEDEDMEAVPPNEGNINNRDNFGRNWQAGPGPEEAGPSGTQRTPSPTLVQRPNESPSPAPERILTVYKPHNRSAVLPPKAQRINERRPPPRPSIHQPEPPSVAISNRSVVVPPRARRGEKRFPSEQPEIRPPPPRQAAVSSRVHKVPSGVAMPPPPAPSQPQSSQATLVGPASSQVPRAATNNRVTHVESAQAVAKAPVRSKPKPRGKAKARESIHTSQDAPARNTRARSRSASLEPLQINEPAPLHAQQPVLEPVGEVEETEQLALQPSGADAGDEDGIREQLNPEATQKEEDAGFNGPPELSSDSDEDDVVIAEQLTQNIPGADEELPASVVQGGPPELSDSDLDEDDAAIVKRLNPTESIADDENLLMRTLEKTKRAASQRSMSRFTSVPRNPTGLSRTSSGRTTEGEEFPITGTRAQRLSNQAEKAPFTPFRGTRAAELRKKGGGII